jgi:hypothetical protein
MRVTTEGQNFYIETTCEAPTLENDEQVEVQELAGKTINQAMYLIVRSLKDREKKLVEYTILEGDIIKWGKISFRVKKIGNNEGAKNEPKIEEVLDQAVEKEESKSVIEEGHFANSAKINFKEAQRETKKVKAITNEEQEQEFRELNTLEIKAELPCRICYETTSNEENPLLISCSCKNTGGLMHKDCLIKWLAMKKQEKIIEHIHSFYWSSFRCEVCHDSLPFTLDAGAPIGNLDLVSHEKSIKDVKNYMILESLE